METIPEENLVVIKAPEERIEVPSKIIEGIVATHEDIDVDFRETLNNPDKYTSEIVAQADKNRAKAIAERDAAIAKIKELMKNKESRIVQI